MGSDAYTLTLRNPWSWYAVVASRDLGPGAIVPVVLNGERLVIWRSAAGQANAWSDRCPHRGMRLSFGAVHQETLICPYHGWTFGDDAYCVRIPAHPGVSPSRAARARVYPVVETSNYVWVCLGEPSTAAPSEEPGDSAVRSIHFPNKMEYVIATFITIPGTPDMGADLVSPLEVKCAREDHPAGEDKTIANSSRLKAEFVAPGTLICEATGKTGKYKYLIRVQPTESGSCAVHGSTHGMDQISFNRSLVNVRTAMQQPELSSWLKMTRAKFDETMPIHLAGLTQGEAP